MNSRFRAEAVKAGEGVVGGGDGQRDVDIVFGVRLPRGGLVQVQEGDVLKHRLIVGSLMLLNVVVLAGQIWPEGAPPFAKTVNVVFLVASLTFLASSLRNSR